ncbi:MAG: urocanate hydratase [Oscillibacter ruminantium]|uniref:urocanate hydratase n=1 Tax=Oscillibacter ruminantium TaxID=1263547 RepID=UPI00030CEE78|nr:urocanate hydratase [Oscillibacter ruminantium]MEA5042910.1 urocanate hydratase [Oscillibacter ruminantium]
MANFDVDKAMTVKLDYDLPEYPTFEEGIRRAPRRESHLTQADKELAIKNALRYIHPDHHAQMAKEFAQELEEHGRIYGYRFRPQGRLTGKPINEYKSNCVEGKAFQVMIENNLDFDVALYPYELVTYGETGQVCQNWMQYRLIKKYLEVMTNEQTLVVMSGHPLGLFHSHPTAPRCIISNGLMVGMYDNQKDFNRAAALGVANYGQMTAGGWMYIGPQGIVHGTFNTLLNAGRLKLGIPEDGNLAGRLFVTAGLGGMSGAQGKAAEIAGAVSIIAEVDESRIMTRYTQGWVSEKTGSLDEALSIAQKKMASKEPCAIAYHGNVVDLLEYLLEKNVHVDLLSDQTSCHVPYDGGYCPQGLTFEQRTEMLDKDPEGFCKLVDKTLRHHYELICKLHEQGTYFFDYGNSFLKAVYDAGETSICKNGENDLDGFIFPSYVEDILGPHLFDYGYGPFRWCCLSRNPDDLDKTDAAAAEYIQAHNRRYQDYDNYVWVRDAKKNKMVVGTQCRILYQDAMGRMNIALKFNEMVRNGEIGPVMLGRDHHDTGGTDSPFRETSNIKDGSNIMAEMATQCYAGNAARGMSLIALHNGGGTGIGKAINGGFGMVLDGSERVDTILRMSMPWDTMVGVSRRAWARNEHAVSTVVEYNEMYKGQDHITLPYVAENDDQLVSDALKSVK